MDSDSDEDEMKIAKKTASEYSSEASIHGIKYVGESSRTKFERLVNVVHD